MFLAKIKQNGFYIAIGCILALMLALFAIGRITFPVIIIFSFMVGMLDTMNQADSKSILSEQK